MSLVVLWSLLKLIETIGVLAFIFTKIFPNKSIYKFVLFIICGLVPYKLFFDGLTHLHDIRSERLPADQAGPDTSRNYSRIFRSGYLHPPVHSNRPAVGIILLWFDRQ